MQDISSHTENERGSYQNVWSATSQGFELSEKWTDVMDKLPVFWNIRYVHSFFVGWENAGLSQFKSEVPIQNVNSVGLTHRFAAQRFQNALTLEAQDLTDAKVFDLFGV